MIQINLIFDSTGIARTSESDIPANDLPNDLFQEFLFCLATVTAQEYLDSMIYLREKVECEMILHVGLALQCLVIQNVGIDLSDTDAVE